MCSSGEILERLQYHEISDAVTHLVDQQLRHVELKIPNSCAYRGPNGCPYFHYFSTRADLFSDPSPFDLTHLVAYKPLSFKSRL